MKKLGLLLSLIIIFSCTDDTNNETTTTDETTSTIDLPDALAAPEGLPENAVYFDDITYKTIDDTALTLDLYLPNADVENAPLLIWTHGGAWFRGSKEAFIGTDKNNRLVNTLLDEGYAIASIGYRLSGVALFPAAIQDCNDAINFLWEHSTAFKVDKNRFAAMGRSAGGHLAALVSISNNEAIADFFTEPNAPKFTIKALVNFFGISDFITMRGPGHDGPEDPEALFLGVYPPIDDYEAIAKKASPKTYVDAQTPPSILFHGLSDNRVPPSQTEELKSALDTMGVTNETYLVEGAGHGDIIFDSEENVGRVLEFLRIHFPVK